MDSTSVANHNMLHVPMCAHSGLQHHPARLQLTSISTGKYLYLGQAWITWLDVLPWVASYTNACLRAECEVLSGPAIRTQTT
jgi:hypothetical protein